MDPRSYKCTSLCRYTPSTSHDSFIHSTSFNRRPRLVGTYIQPPRSTLSHGMVPVIHIKISTDVLTIYAAESHIPIHPMSLDSCKLHICPATKDSRRARRKRCQDGGILLLCRHISRDWVMAEPRSWSKRGTGAR
jgi:hypothetical protein